jgi:1-deoxy-D-xylulose-5-phosphate reductoisomerase
VLAQLGPADMRTAIGYCLGWPRRPAIPVKRLDFAEMARLDFEAPDETRFPALRLAREALAKGGLVGAVLNGAKEAALDAFIAGRIRFLQMAELVEAALHSMPVEGHASAEIGAIVEADRAARAEVESLATALAF